MFASLLATAWHAGGQRFESAWLHLIFLLNNGFSEISQKFRIKIDKIILILIVNVINESKNLPKKFYGLLKMKF